MQENKIKNKHCSQCKKILSGEMIFNPELCFFCVVDKHCSKNKKSLKSPINKKKKLLLF